MVQMFTEISQRQRPRRSPAGLAVSLVLHIAACAGVVYLVRVSPSALPRPIEQALTFVTTSPLPVIPPPSLTMPLPARRATAMEIRRTELPELRETPPPPTLEIRRADVPSALPAPQPMPRQLTARPEPPRPLPAPVTVAAFPSTAVQTRAAEPSRQLQTTGFDAPAARSPELKSGSSTVGAFDRATATDARPGSDRPASAVVADAGFGSTGSAPARSSTGRTLGETGFDNTNNDGRTRRPEGPAVAEVRPSGFADAQTVGPSKRPPTRPERIAVPVEVTFKPAPTYTDEARALKLEGEVLLEVEFSATGQVRILRIVSGLGHGLDEAATHAAERIQFKPARSDSGPIDSRAIVHITFRLT
jgi:TonB family protein